MFDVSKRSTVELFTHIIVGTGGNCHGGWHASLIAHKLWRFRNTEDFYLYWYSIE